MVDILTLIKEVVSYDSLRQPIKTESTNDIAGSIFSITRAEWSASGQLGFQPSFMFKTPHINYGGEKLASYNGDRYTIYRTYKTGDVVELYLEKRAGN